MIKDFFLSQWRNNPLVGQGLTITHQLDAPHSVRLTRPSDQPDTETSTLPYKPQQSQTETSVPQAGFEPIIKTSEQAEIHSLDRVATGIRDRDL